MTPIIRDYKLCYLATPYSKWPTGIHNAFVAASALAAKLMRDGVKVYSPIAHTHPLAIYGNIDALDHSIWLPFDESMMRVSEALLVAQMPGWKTSRGIAHEIDFFEKLARPVHLLPEQFCMEF
jgi:hypothetical protein